MNWNYGDINRCNPNDPVLIPRAAKDDNWDPTQNAPMWSPIVKRKSRDSEEYVPAKPVVRCKCGQWFGLGLHHVHSDGRVTASFFHKDGCGWHVFLKLVDYDQGEFMPEPA